MSTLQWSVYLKRLPTEKGKPVILFVGNNKVFESKDDGNDVFEHFQTDFVGFSSSNIFLIKIPVMEDFQGAKKFNLDDGQHIKFEYTPGGLAITQQEQPF